MIDYLAMFGEAASLETDLPHPVGFVLDQFKPEVRETTMKRLRTFLEDACRVFQDAFLSPVPWLFLLCFHP